MTREFACGYVLGFCEIPQNGHEPILELMELGNPFQELQQVLLNL